MTNPEITIVQGKLRGSTAKTANGDLYYKFQGIPYAKPPFGPLRFKAPEAPEKWTGIFDATKEGSSCYSRHELRTKEIIGSENCLFLNVYTRRLLDRKTLDVSPVLVWIHGGGFLKGSSTSEIYGPDFLLTEDVVLVTINYRFGILGFLSLENPALGVPGNTGLKDVVMALKWVQKNIFYFNGNPNNVTIFGQSAGGTIVHLLMLSKMSKGLFHKAIAQSGCALNPWSIGKSGVEEIASVLNLEDLSEEDIYDRLKQMPVEEIHNVQEKIVTLQTINGSDHRPFAYVVEKKISEPAFLEEDPLDIMVSGRFNHVPLIIGYTTAETMVLDIFRKVNWSVPHPLEHIIPWTFGYQLGTKESQGFTTELQNYYYNNQVPSQRNMDKKIIMNSDLNLINPISTSVLAMLRSSTTPIYLYRISVDTELNFTKRVSKPGLKMFQSMTDLPDEALSGVAHADELGYLFKQDSTPEIKPGSKEDVAVKRFVKLWTTFARYGFPTPHTNDDLVKVVWKPVTNEKIDFLDIGENLRALSNPSEYMRLKFLRNLHARRGDGKKTKAHL